MPRTVRRERDAPLQFKHNPRIEREALRFVARIPQHDRRLSRAPSSPTVNFQFERIASDPVGVEEFVGVVVGPNCGLRQVVPILLSQQRMRDIKLLQLSARPEVTANLIPEIVAGSVSRPSACEA